MTHTRIICYITVIWRSKAALDFVATCNGGSLSRISVRSIPEYPLLWTNEVKKANVVKWGWYVEVEGYDEVEEDEDEDEDGDEYKEEE